MKDQPLTQAQSNEFQLNYLGYYVKVKEDWQWNNDIKKSVRKGFLFDIVQYDNDQEVIIQKGTKVFPMTEHEAIRKRDEIISFYLKKLKNN